MRGVGDEQAGGYGSCATHNILLQESFNSGVAAVSAPERRR